MVTKEHVSGTVPTRLSVHLSDHLYPETIHSESDTRFDLAAMARSPVRHCDPTVVI